MKAHRMVMTVMMAVASVVASLHGMAESIEKKIDGIKYELNTESMTAKVISDYSDFSYQITGVYRPYKGKKSIHIPSRVKYKDKDYCVVAIGFRAFMNCASLESVSFPDSLKVIEDYAFEGCSGIRQIDFPPALTSIGYSAFRDCSITDIAIHPSIEIEYNAFAGCPLKTAKLPLKYAGERWLHNVHKIIPFSWYAEPKIKEEIAKWQAKAEFESTAQWKQRVNEQTRAAKVKELTIAAKNEFMKEMMRLDEYDYRRNKRLGTYDADNNILPVVLPNGTFYFNIDAENAAQIKNNEYRVKLTPEFVVTGDTLALSSLTLEYKGLSWKPMRSVEIVEQDLALDLPPLEIDLGVSQGDAMAATQTTIRKVSPKVSIDDAIDKQIPVNSATNKGTFAVVIGNENYQRVSQVPFAANDAKTFAQYCHKTLGIPHKNIRSYVDATFATLISAIDDIKSIVAAYNGDVDVIFYYAGHGIPNERSGDAYLLPIDTDGRNTAVCYSLGKLYEELGGMGAKSVTVFLDACFSGAERGSGMLASARGVAIKPRSAALQGNMVVFSAASGDETAYPYDEKGHGLFTYYLLRKLQETKGDATLGELGRYVVEEVRRESVVSNGKSQTPTVSTSDTMTFTWLAKKLR